MGSVLIEILPLAIGVAISPLPIVAVILMLFSEQARSNGFAFLGGWVLGMAVVGGIVFTLADSGELSTGEGGPVVASLLRLLLGFWLLYRGYRQWRERPAPGTELEIPQWMAGIEAFTPGRTLVLGALLSGLNPKNLALTAAAAVSISMAGLSGASAWIALLVFIVIASISVAIPIFYYLLAGEKAQRTLEVWKTWLTSNNATMMTVLLLVFGLVLVVRGLVDLIV